MSSLQAYRQLPYWRKGGVAVQNTSAMLAEIMGFVKKFSNLQEEQKEWVRRVYEGEALAGFLYQVNHIEGEGLSTLEKTKKVISKGILDLDPQQLCIVGNRLKAVHCLHRALQHWFRRGGENSIPHLDEDTLLKSHQSLLGPIRPNIAGRFRNKSEIVYVQRLNGSKHYFLPPEIVVPALKKLFEKANRELEKIFMMENVLERIESLFKFAGSFFFEYECIHPFVDGNGRTGRVMLAYILQSVTLVFPNILLVDQLVLGIDPPFVDEDDYQRCFEMAHESVDKVPRDLSALIIEGVYVGWKTLFHAMVLNGNKQEWDFDSVENRSLVKRGLDPSDFNSSNKLKRVRQHHDVKEILKGEEVAFNSGKQEWPINRAQIQNLVKRGLDTSDFKSSSRKKLKRTQQCHDMKVRVTIEGLPTEMPRWRKWDICETDRKIVVPRRLKHRIMVVDVKTSQMLSEMTHLYHQHCSHPDFFSFILFADASCRITRCLMNSTTDRKAFVEFNLEQNEHISNEEKQDTYRFIDACEYIELKLKQSVLQFSLEDLLEVHSRIIGAKEDTVAPVGRFLKQLNSGLAAANRLSGPDRALALFNLAGSTLAWFHARRPFRDGNARVSELLIAATVSGVTCFPMEVRGLSAVKCKAIRPKCSNDFTAFIIERAWKWLPSKRQLKMEPHP